MALFNEILSFGLKEVIVNSIINPNIIKDIPPRSVAILPINKFNFFPSIKPKYVAKILNGEKTIEVRKSKPKSKLPIQVYIYCTKGKKNYHFYQ